MIKRLIKDLTYNNITLTEGLSRAKIIAFEINNSDFKNWINYELNGYKLENIPNHRILKCEIVADIQSPFHGSQTIPFDLSNWDTELKGMIYKMNVLQSIPTIEANIKIVKDKINRFLFEHLPIELVETFKKLTTHGDDIIAIKRKIQVSQVMHILEITKQKLVDTLLELNQSFPNLEDDFENTKENIEVTKTIINNNIYGNTENSNINFGNNTKQTLNTKKDKEIQSFLEYLKEINLKEDEITEVATIIETNKNDKNFSTKMLNWLGKLATKAVEKGIELNIPMILEKVQQII